MVSPRALCLFIVGLLALERVAELLLSRRNAARAFARGATETGQTHYRVMAAFHTCFLIACAALASRMETWPGTFGWMALFGALLAQGLRYWAIATLGDRWNVRVITLPGAPPITSGPYRWVRHPNYIAVALELLFVPLIFGGWGVALAFSVGNALLMLTRIRVEEAALGSTYTDAFARVPRFFPGRRA